MYQNPLNQDNGTSRIFHCLTSIWTLYCAHCQWYFLVYANVAGPKAGKNISRSSRNVLWTISQKQRTEYFYEPVKSCLFFSPSLFTLICLPPDKRAACQGEGRMEGNGRETSSRTEQGNVTAYILVASHLMAIVLIVF